MRFHDNAWLRSLDASPPRPLSAYHIAVLIKSLGVLPEIPDVAVPVLRKIVKRILLQDAADKNSVVDYPTSYSVDDYRAVGNRKHISFLAQFLAPLVNKSNAWWQREKRIVDFNCEIRGINIVGHISCVCDCQIQCRQRQRSCESSYYVLLFHIRFPPLVDLDDCESGRDAEPSGRECPSPDSDPFSDAEFAKNLVSPSRQFC